MAIRQANLAYDDQIIGALEQALSSSRLESYRRASLTDPPLSYELYLWNSRLAKAMLFPLNVVEVTVRNSMYTALAEKFSNSDWVLDPAQHYAYFNEFTLSSHKKSVERLSTKDGAQIVNAGSAIAALTFDFWSNLLRSEYKVLWNGGGTLERAFPLATGKPLSMIRGLVAEINFLRNRIAHHEPIHKMDLKKEYRQILEVIGMICAQTADWVKCHSTLEYELAGKPKKSPHFQGAILANLNLRKPVVVSPEERVLDALAKIVGARPPVAVVSGEAVKLVSMKSIMQYFEMLTKENRDGLLVTSEAISAVLDFGLDEFFCEVSGDATTSEAISLFFPRGVGQGMRPQFLLVKNRDEFIGVVQHPVVKY